MKGRKRPVVLFEPLGLAGGVAPDLLAQRDAFLRALHAWRRGSFAEATAAFEMLADSDPVAAHFAALARGFATNPPTDWDGVSVLTEK